MKTGDEIMGDILNFLVQIFNSNILDKRDKRIVDAIFVFIEKDTVFKIATKFLNRQNIEGLKKLAFDASVAKEKLIFKLDEYDFSISIQNGVLSKIYAYIYLILPKYAFLEMPKNIAFNFLDNIKDLKEELSNSKRVIATSASAYYMYKTIFNESNYEGVAKLKKLNTKSKEILGSSIFELSNEIKLLTDDDIINLTSASSILNDFTFENQINLIFDICMEKKQKLSEESVKEFDNISKSKTKKKECTLYL